MLKNQSIISSLLTTSPWIALGGGEGGGTLDII